MHWKHVWAIFALASCASCAATLHGAADAEETEEAAQRKAHRLVEEEAEQRKAWRLIDQLQDSLSSEQRTATLRSLIDEIGDIDDSLIISVLGQQMKKHEIARKVILPRFADLLRSAREGNGWRPERRLCQLIDVLVQVGEAPPEAVAEAEAVLKDSKDYPFAAPKAAALLLYLNPTGHEAQRWLGEKLQSKSREERARAASAIGTAGKRAEPMAAKLQPLLKDEAVEVRVLAACSLWSIDPRSGNVVGVLQQSLGEEPKGIHLKEPTYRWALDHRHVAVLCLGKMEASARDTASDIARLLKDDDQTLRWFAAMALGTIGASTPEVLKALEAAKGDRNVAVSRSAARSLERLTGEKPPAKPKD